MTALLKPSPAPATPSAAVTGGPPRGGADQPLLSELRVLRILTGISMHYWRNRMAFYMAALRRKPAPDAPGGGRQATPGKQPVGRWLTVLLALSFVWLGFLQGANYLARMAERLNPMPRAQASTAAVEQAGGTEAGKQTSKEDLRFDRLSQGRLWSGGPGDQPLVLALGLYLLLLSLAQLAFLLGSGQQDLGKVAWDMEWLFTFPVPARTLFLARLLQNATVGQLSFWAMMTPCLAIAYGCAGYGWWTLPLALMATGSVALCNASLALLVETWAQKKLAPGRRKNLQAVLALAASTLSLLTMAIGLSETLDGIIEAIARALPLALAANPFSLPAIACGSGWEAPAAVALLGLLGLTLPLGSVQLAQGLVRDGLVASPGAYQGERRRWPAGAASSVSWLDGVVGKELRLLARDRAFLVQTLLTPAIILGFTFILHWRTGTGLLQQPRQAATLAFGMGAYVLVFSAFQALAAEGNGLWLLYTVPKDLGMILVRKTCLWCCFAVAYAVAVLAVAGLAGMPLDGEAGLAGGLAVAGVVIYAFIAAALGILAANPLTADVQRRVRVDVVYAYLVLAGFYAAALQGPSLWALLAQVVLSALVGVALWQKAQDRLPYLLDSTAAAPPRVSVADGLIAALAFLTVQSFVGALLAVGTPLSVGPRLLIATAVAGVIVTLAALVLLRRVQGLLVVTGLVADRTRENPGLLRTLTPGVLAGLLAGLFGVAYLGILNRVETLRVWKESWAILSPLDDLSLLVWVVLAAPLFEEFIFRGLLYQGLRRSAPPWVAVVASAAVFAVVHPPIAAVPVFVLGVAAALSLRRSGRLVTPVVAHLLYNAIVVTAEGLMRNGTH